MSDIFISYSRKDSEQALSLAERLQAQGMSVWIDQRGIEAATSWSGEIVDAIEGCTAFLILLSSHSMQSENVARELSIAYENKCKLLPVAIEDVPLARDFKYPLAGIQRVAYTQHDSITQALIGCGITLSKQGSKRDERKSLMILPFEDLSPTQDNGWFADGLVSEMIDKLSKIKSLKLVDRQTSLQIKKKGHTIAELANILDVRYFIEGSIRKFGEQVKISSALLDFETGDYLWQDTHKGAFGDIFEIQEAIAEKVVDGLKLHLGSDEKKDLVKKPTVNADAYEFFLKAREEYHKYTREGFERALALYAEAIRFDPEFAHSYANLAGTQLELHRTYDRSPARLEAAERAIREVRRIEGESKLWCWIMSWLHRNKDDYPASEHYARRTVEIDPESAFGYNTLGNALHHQNRLEETVEAYQEVIKRRPESFAYYNLLISLKELGDSHTLQQTAVDALPTFEKRLRLCPDDLQSAVLYANVLSYAGKPDEAREHAHTLLHNPDLDAMALYVLAGLLCNLDERTQALGALRRSVDLGYSEIENFRIDPDLVSLRELPEFKALLKEVEDKIAVQSNV